MNTVERIKEICKNKKIPISRLEKDCGFANGYISQLKKGSLPDDRLRIVSEYLNVTVYFLQFGKEKEPVETDPFMLKMMEIAKNATPDQKKMILGLADTVLREK